MKCIPTQVEGAFIIKPTKFGDDRGFFSPMFEDKLFQKHNLCSSFSRVNCSLSTQKGTIRGLHFQLPPFQETKMLRVLRGAVWDVALDLRKDSPTYKQWTGVTLTPDDYSLFYIPAGCAHGFQTLEPNTEVLYLCNSYYNVEHERGIRWDDPHFSIPWPLPPSEISDKDKHHPNFLD